MINRDRWHLTKTPSVLETHSEAFSHPREFACAGQLILSPWFSSLSSNQMVYSHQAPTWLLWLLVLLGWWWFTVPAGNQPWNLVSVGFSQHMWRSLWLVFSFLFSSFPSAHAHGLDWNLGQQPWVWFLIDKKSEKCWANNPIHWLFSQLYEAPSVPCNVQKWIR